MPLRVLVADDNAVKRKIALAMLTRLGYSADAVEDGRAAVAAVAGSEYDVILMDVEMPERTGARRRPRSGRPRSTAGGRGSSP